MQSNNRTLLAILLGLFVAIHQVQPSPLLRGRKQEQEGVKQSKQGVVPIRGIAVNSSITEGFLAQTSRIMKSKKKATQRDGNNDMKNTNNKARRKKKNKKPQSNPDTSSNTSDKGATSNNHATTLSPTSKPTVSLTTKPTLSPTQAYHVTGWQDSPDGDGAENDEDDGSRDYIARDPYVEYYEDEKEEQDEPEPIQKNNSGNNSSTNKKKKTVDYYEYGWWWFISSDSPTPSPKSNPTTSPTPYVTRAERVDAINVPAEPIQDNNANSEKKKNNKKKKKNTDYYGWWWMSYYTDSPTSSPTVAKENPTQVRSDHVTGWEDYWKPHESGNDEDGSEDYISEENGTGRGGNGVTRDPIQDEEPNKKAKKDLDYYGWWWFHD